MLSLLYGLCGLSGASVLIYISFWTRQFGNLFGNTFYTSLLVVTTCLVAAGAGSLVLGGWADRNETRSGASLGTFARLQWLIAALGLAVSLVLPYVGFVSGLVSFYSRGGNGWYHISILSSALRALTALVLFGPAMFLLGGALAILGGWLVSERGARPISRLALLAGAFAIGGALGLALAEFVIAPYAGARIAELVAVLFNIGTALVAARLATIPERIESVGVLPAPGPNAAALTNIGIGLCSAVALSLVLLWVRHLTLLLGGFRFTKSLLFVFVALGFGTGLLMGALLLRHTRRPAQWLIAALAVLVVAMLFGIGMVDISGVLAATSPLTSAFDGTANAVGAMAELWLNAKPILVETSIPAVLIGMSFALALGIVQTGDGPARVARLLASAAAGAVLGLLATALVLLSRLGMQGAALVLALLTAVATIPFDLATRGMPGTRRVLSATGTLIASLAVSAVAIGLWVLLPSGDIITRATIQQSQDERLLALSEGPGEFVAVTESLSAGRELVTDDHSTSASNPLGRRSMRALAHIPLALADRPERVLVIGFGIGHTAHAAALHPSVQRVDVVEPSAQVLSDASFFKDANKDVLSDRKTSVFVNDGRQHLRMQSPATYDVIAVGSEPLTLDRSAALYSREFYELARTRLKPGGYLSRWLPLYQVAPSTLLGMIRAFVDVFPQSVLLGATDQELLLLGVNASTGPTLDPDRLAAKLTAPPLLTADLETVDLANVQEFVMTLMASSQKLAAATRQNAAASDDRPAQEFAARSRVTSIYLAGMPGDLADLSGMSTWCPSCFVGGAPAPALAGLNAASPMLLALYAQALPPERGAGSPTDPVTQQLIKENQFLQNVIAQHVARRNARGVALATDNKLDEAITEFRGALRLNPSDPVTHWNLGRALVSRGQPRDALDELRRAVELDPSGGPAHYDLASTLLDLDQVDAAIDEFRATLVAMPNSVEAHNNLGIALGRKGRLSEAIGEFQQALKINPESSEARHNLDAALMAARAAR